MGRVLVLLDYFRLGWNEMVLLIWNVGICRKNEG